MLLNVKYHNYTPVYVLSTERVECRFLENSKVEKFIFNLSKQVLKHIL